ncbi:MAG: hypothetical protein QG578_2115 [Thermodesulfobacteriota bacterium]|nr:hypothetical protein [Thermodesulfobacteriota bacterium]
MDTDRIGGRRLKSKIFEILSGKDFHERLSEIRRFPGRQVVNHLFSCLYNIDELIKWRAVTAMGDVVSSLADADIESARVVMRRLMWNLNDESGGIGWGSPEAMGEIIARNMRLGEEYNRILISYINIDGNYLENEVLQQGVIWGIGRIAIAKPHLVRDSFVLLISFLESGDVMLRGLSAWALGAIDPVKARYFLLPLKNDDSVVKIYSDGIINRFMIKNIVNEILSEKMSRVPQ